MIWPSLRARNQRQRSASAPDGVRIYAVGDVHGRADLLHQLFARIDADLAAYPVDRAIQILLGDYIDRGPYSRQVLDMLIDRSRSHSLVCLKGNHETYLTEFIRNPAVLPAWKQYGGFETLISYGVRPTMNVDERQQAELASAFDRALPESHRQFLSGLPASFTCGDFFFVHAGVRPGIPLAKQQEDDLLWIREDFLLHEENYEKVIVHGHTPVTLPDIHPNRINIDTGAFATGQLTCLRIQRDDLVFI